MYSVLELAKYIVSKCIKDKHEISNLQLQKILFSVQREFLQKLRKRAFPESIEAWPFGAVVPEVYYYFSGSGAMRIGLCDDPDEAVMQSISSEDKKLIDSITESKRDLAVWDLADETNKHGGAWESIYNNGSGNKKIIPAETIKSLG